MTRLHTAVEDYLALRRRLGYALQRDGRLLPNFADYLECAGASHITTELALAWAMLPRDVHPGWWRQRLGIVRGFSRYLTAFDPSSEVPPPDLLRAHRSRVTPYVYSAADVAGLMRAARQLSPVLRASTYATLVGLLTTTGLRLGEALGLDRTAVDLDAGVLSVRGKGDAYREVPLHHSTVEAALRYCHLRDQRWRRPQTASFFISTRGARLSPGTVHYTFSALVRAAGLEGRGARCRPRPHDLRHTFAIRTLLTWYRDSVDVDAQLPLLSTFLGHVDPAATYWYLSAAPELLALASQRLELHMLGDPS